MFHSRTPIQWSIGPWYTGVLIGIFLLSLGANAVLLKQNQHFQVQLRHAGKTPIGLPLIPLTGTDFAGRHVSLDLGKTGTRSVLFVYSPQCGPSNRNWGTWAALLPDITASGFTPIYVDVSGTTDAAFIRQHHLDHFTVFRDLSAETKLAYMFRLTPMTVVFDRKGRARDVWAGALSRQELLDFKRLLRVLQD